MAICLHVASSEVNEKVRRKGRKQFFSNAFSLYVSEFQSWMFKCSGNGKLSEN